MHILHLSTDYPDPLAPAKTRAVANLLELAHAAEPLHEHRVMSLNRIGWRAGIHAIGFADGAGEAHRSIAYGAPGKGLFLRRFLDRVADWIADECKGSGFAPDLIHAHKLSMEGIIAAKLAERWSIPFVLSVQGNTDLKIVKARPDLKTLYTSIWHAAEIVFPFAPWASAGLDQLLGRRSRPVLPLPCPTPADQIIAPVRSAAPVICTAFNFRDAANKNAAGLIRAVAHVAKEIPDLRLEIIGGGDPQAFAMLSALGDRVASGRVRFLGRIPITEIQNRFNAATCFALVSRRETYGMVFAEALLAGAPCLIPRGRAIDGYFEDGSVVLSADPEDEAEIAAALLRLVREEEDFKTRLGQLGTAGGLEFMTRDTIRDRYLGALASLGRGKTGCDR